MNNHIELLDIQLLDSKSKLTEIDHWLNIFNWPNGWHYDLDIIWILDNLERMTLPRGATIIDAGAGLGMTQFILAARGYNIISLDFTDRKIPHFSKNIFTINLHNRDLGAYKHEYMNFMTYGDKTNIQGQTRKSFFERLKNVNSPEKLYIYLGAKSYQLSKNLKNTLNLPYVMETFKDHSSFGNITFLRGTFNSIPLPDSTADAIVSVSAFEHNTYEDMPGSVKEFERVLKKDAPMFITTSASQDKDWYFEPPKAWNFSKETLASWFDVPAQNISFNYKKVFENITNSEILKKRMSPFYKFGRNNGLPLGNLKEAKFLPVGITKVKK